MGATLCIDAGTTLIKAVVFDSAGRELTISKQATAVRSPHPGEAEQDMNEVWSAVLAVATDAISASGVPVDLVCITAQGDGAWMIDAGGNPSGNAILWNDARAVAVLRRWAGEGVLDRAFTINGSLSNLGVPNTIMASLLSGDAHELDDVTTVMTCGSWLFHQLTGVTGLHISEASAPWLDIAAGRYSSELFDLYGLGAYRSLIPPVLTADEVVQPMLAQVAAAIGCSAGTPVVLAPYDVVATAAGGGAVDAGAAFCILGTTLCTGMVAATPDTSGAPAGLTLRVSADGPLIRAFPTLAGTGVVDWLARLTGAQDARAITALAAASPPGAAGVRVWPYLSPAGERAPFLDAAARGVIAGLTFEHSSSDIARATVEGLAHVVRDCLEATGEQPHEIALSGGGSASDVWCSAIADITGVTTVRTTDTQIGAKGAMIYATTAVGDYPTVAAATSALVTRGRSFDADDRLRTLYDERHRDFLDTRDALATRWASW